MEDGLDSGLDIGFVNYKKHPSDPNYMVFRFKDHKMADYFRSELESHSIWFEEGEDILKNDKKVVMFGVHRTDYKRAQKINYDTSAKLGSRFIKDKPLRIVMLTFLFLLIGFAIFGVIKVNFFN